MGAAAALGEKVRGWVRGLGGASLGTRFAVTFAAVAAAVIVLMGSLAYSAAATLIRNSAEQEFNATVSNVAQTLRNSSTGNSRFHEFTLVHSERFSFQLINGAGEIMVPLGGGRASAPLPVTEADRAVAGHYAGGLVHLRDDNALGEPLRVATVSFGQGLGAVQIVQRLQPTERLLDTLAAQLVVVGVVALVGAGLAGWLVARRITSRLVRLTEAAEYVTSTGRLDRAVSDGGTSTGGRDEVGRLGAAFNEMLGRLAAAKEEQRRLVQNASHELRTPLTSLRTNVSVMKQFDRLSPEAQQRLVDDLQGETRELTDLVNELVSLATETYQDEPVQEVVLREVAERVAARSRRRTGREIIVDAAWCVGARDLQPGGEQRQVRPGGHGPDRDPHPRRGGGGPGPGARDRGIRARSHLRTLLPFPGRARPARLRARPVHGPRHCGCPRRHRVRLQPGGRRRGDRHAAADDPRRTAAVTAPWARSRHHKAADGVDPSAALVLAAHAAHAGVSAVQAALPARPPR